MSLEELKAQWLADPCWDIEDTQGFEAQRQELYVFRLEIELAQLREQVAGYAKLMRLLSGALNGDLTGLAIRART